MVVTDSSIAELTISMLRFLTQKNKQMNSYITRYSFYGLITGLFVNLLIVINGVINHSSEFSVYHMFEYVKTHETSWLLFFIVVLLFTAGSYFFGIYITGEQERLQEKLDDEIAQKKNIHEFAEQLRIGSSFGQEIHLGGDELSESLINLRNDLQKREKNEKLRKQEEYERHWITEGLASFAVILRETHRDLETLSYSVVSELAKYLSAQIVGIFIINDTDANNKYIEQTGSFAYERKKFTDKKLEWGEGLVGGCILEKKTVFIKDVTEGYVEITSGLGKSNPRCILIVPLIFNEEIYGAIEIASLKVLQDYEIEFVEKLGDSIASSISSIKINMRTAVLLKDSQKGQEIMKRQEAEMRNSMRELREIQIKSAQQSEEFTSFTNSVDESLMRAEYSPDGTLIYANQNFLNKLGYSSIKEIEGQSITMFLHEEDRAWFNDLLSRIVKGREHFEDDIKHITKSGDDLWLIATYVGVKTKKGEVTKLLFLGMDVTKYKQENAGYIGQLDAINRSTIKADFTPKGKIIEFNQKFQEAMFYESLELQDKTIFDFISSSEINEFSIIWKNIAAGVPFERRIKMITKNGEIRWFHGTFSVINNLFGDISKIVYIAYDVTSQIRTENINREQSEKLKLQEQKINHSRDELTKKLREAREEIRLQYTDVEVSKILNEKVMDRMLEAVVTIDQNNEIKFFNQAAEKLWGINKKQVLNKNIKIILPDKHKDRGENYMGNFFNYENERFLDFRRDSFIVNDLEQKVKVSLSMSEAQFGKNYHLTAFIQKS